MSTNIETKFPRSKAEHQMWPTNLANTSSREFFSAGLSVDCMRETSAAMRSPICGAICPDSCIMSCVTKLPMNNADGLSTSGLNNLHTWQQKRFLTIPSSLQYNLVKIIHAPKKKTSRDLHQVPCGHIQKHSHSVISVAFPPKQSFPSFPYKGC
jgi:hypothetical protein